MSSRKRDEGLGWFDRIGREEFKKEGKKHEKTKGILPLGIEKAPSEGGKPFGVIVVALIFAFIAVVSLILSNIIVTEMLPQQHAYFMLQIWGVLFPYIIMVSEFGGWLVPPSFGGTLLGFEVLNIMSSSLLVTAGAAVLTSTGLLVMKRERYYLGLFFGAVLVIIAFYSVWFKAIAEIRTDTGLLYVCMLLFFIVGVATIPYLAHKFEEETAKPGSTGVLTLATFLVIATVIILVGSLIALIRTIPDLKTADSLQLNMGLLMVYQYPQILYGECSPFIGYDFSHSNITYFELVSWSELLVSGLGIPSSMELMRMRSRGRILALTLGTALIIFGIFTFFCEFVFILGIFPLMLGAGTIAHLTGEVKYKFEVTPEKVEHFIKTLQDKDWWVRVESARALKVIGGENEVGPLIQALRDEEWRVRKEATAALGRIGGERVVKPLILASKDQNKNVRRAAELALIQIKRNKLW
nr:HEAT repeat domain-containing protein [Candidatus Freyarchaeota archaeon]